jgi:8-oxo-dGTP pyrophosphatase MutT (NUDIX family)
MVYITIPPGRGPGTAADAGAFASVDHSPPACGCNNWNMTRSNETAARSLRASLSRLRRACEPAIRRSLHVYWRFRRGMTLGVRALVLDGNRIFLVKHSYVDGWHLPGGGVEVGETMLQSLARELMEEGNIAITGTPVLHGAYFNARISRRDHVALYVVRDFHQEAPHSPTSEIVATGFFSIDALPADTTPATRARIAEVFFGAPVSDRW